MKNIIIPVLVIVLIVIGIIYFGGKNGNSAISYFDENAKVMYFYSETCSWCQKQKPILEDLAKEGYKVKPMDVGEHQQYWKEYDISGTPTFAAPDGQKKVGYQEKTELKEFLGKYR